MSRSMAMQVQKGTLRVGQGIERPMHHIVCTAPYGDASKVEVFLSADDKSIWLQLSEADARELAARLLAPYQR